MTVKSTRVTHAAVAATTALGIFGSCQESEVTTADPPAHRPVGTLISAWGEDRFDSEQVEAIDPQPEALFTTQTEFDAWLELADPELGLDEVRSIDLDSTVVVVGSYGNCMAQGHVTVEETGGDSLLSFGSSQIEEVDCDWAPLTVEVWAIDRDDLVGTPQLAP